MVGRGSDTLRQIPQGCDDSSHGVVSIYTRRDRVTKPDE